MVKKYHQDRFGIIALSKRFINIEQLAEAIKIQANEDLKDQAHRLIGEILIDLGYMDRSQVGIVVKLLVRDDYMLKCPKCGILLYECPSCGFKPKDVK